MDEERLQAYLRLIQKLLSCPSGKEPEILNSHQDLVDGELVQVMQQVAKWLAQEGDKDNAEFLTSVARQLAEALGLSSTSPTSSQLPTADSQLNFLIEVLQATGKSNGNPQVVYPLLQANLDQLDDNLAVLLRDWATATLKKVEQQQARGIAGIILNFSILIQEFPRGSRAINLEIAITGYEVVGTVFTREAFPRDWAITQNNLGNAYRNRIRGNKADNLEDAIEAYQKALEVYTREAFPQKWATIQNNLGNAYSERIRGKKADNLEAAIKAYQGALQVYTREAFPQKWAGTQNNLAIGYRNRIRGKKADNLEAAIKACQGALQVYTREACPQKWAMTQNNLAAAYSERIRGEKEDNIEVAIKVYQEALQVYTREAFPQKWAMTQYNLGNAYRIEVAIKVYQEALQVCTREAFPQKWAMTQYNLRNAYRQNIRGNLLEPAIKAYQGALQVYTSEAFPQNHAETLFNLGLAYQDAQQLTNAYHTFSEAIETVESLRGEIVSGSGIEADKQKLAEQYNQVYSSMVEVCLELNKPTEAIEYVERSKGRNLVERLADKTLYPKRDRYPNPEVYKTHCQQLDQLRKEILAIQRELEILKINRESEEEYRETIKKQQQRLNRLKHEQDNLLKEINQLDLSFQFTQQVEPILFSDIQTLIDKHTAIIEWYITDNQILTFIITVQNQHPQVRQSSSEERKALIDSTNEHLTTIDLIDKHLTTDYEKEEQWKTHLDKLLKRLAQILHIEEILPELPQECEQLILIPHRFLHLFPLHALPIENRKQQANNSEEYAQTNNAYLLDLFPKGVRYAPSCKLLQLSQNQQCPDFSKLFAIQNPTNDLYYADLEVKNILPLFSSFQVFAKQDATEAAVKTSQEMPLSHCSHFSCHGEFNRKSPLESALILAIDESPEDGRLTVAEIFELSLNQCCLVTLSACETGITAVIKTTDSSTYDYSSDEDRKSTRLNSSH